MPTGLTSKIYEGKDITFKEFAILCARQFGALIHMRDEPLDAPIVKREPDSFYSDKLRNLYAELEDFHNNPPTPEGLAIKWEREVKRLKAEDNRRNREREELKKRYEDMLELVKNWAPPTAEHQNLKSFMIDQIESSIKYDCVESDAAGCFPSKEQYIEDNITPRRIEKDIAYYQDKRNSELLRAEQCNKWIDQLVESLSNYEQMA